MFKRLPTLTDRLVRLHKPPADSSQLKEAEHRIWAAMQDELTSLSMEKTLSHRSWTGFSPAFGSALLALVILVSYGWIHTRLPENAFSPGIQSSGALERLLSTESIRSQEFGYGINKTSFGYRKSQTASGNPSVAYAAENGLLPAGYQPTEFYSDDPAHDNVVNPHEHIFSRELENGSVRQISFGADSSETSPVFSSSTQRLAYRKDLWQAGSPTAPYDRPFQTVIADLSSGKEVTSLGGTASYEPISWSPDGRYLSLVSYQEPAGEVALYDTQTKAVRSFPNPDSSVPSLGGAWLDNATFSFAFDSASHEGSSRLYSIKAASGTMQPIGSRSLSLVSYQIAGNQVFYSPIGQAENNVDLPHYLMAFSLSDPDHLRQLTATKDFVDYQVRYGSDGAPASLLFATFQQSGWAGSAPYAWPVGDSEVKELDLAASTVRLVKTLPKLQISRFIGWYRDDGQAIYAAHPGDGVVAADPRKMPTSYHVLDMREGTDTTLFSIVP